MRIEIYTTPDVFPHEIKQVIDEVRAVLGHSAIQAVVWRMEPAALARIASGNAKPWDETVASVLRRYGISPTGPWPAVVVNGRLVAAGPDAPEKLRRYLARALARAYRRVKRA